MSNEKVTKPTIETVLERLVALEGRLNTRFDGVDTKFSSLEERLNINLATLEERVNIKLERLDVRFDRLETVANATRGDMLELRTDIRELRGQLRGNFPATP
jgi:chromosome segregation ATPase